MPVRSDAEWRELYVQLKALADDEHADRTKRQKARAIMMSIPREYWHAPPPVYDDYDFNERMDGKIV